MLAERRKWRRLVTTVVVVLVAIAVGVGGGLLLVGGRHSTTKPSAQGSPQPSSPQPPPPTVVDSPSCKPPAQHPDPVVLVPGTFADTSWATVGPALAQRGYCVSTLSYGNAGTADMVTSAHELARFVDAALKRTGAQQVAIIGHSEGGLMPRYYMKFLGGAAKVGDLVALSPSNHGTTNPLALVGALSGCTACGQQLTWGSSFLAHLNAGDETPGPASYTVIQTRYDNVVIPYTSAFLSGPSARVTNVTLQDRCPADAAGHLTITTDPVALQWVENALARPGPADPAFRPTC